MTLLDGCLVPPNPQLVDTEILSGVEKPEISAICRCLSSQFPAGNVNIYFLRRIILKVLKIV